MLFIITIILFILASSINTYLLHLQKRKCLTKWLGQIAFKVFCFITFIPWILFVISETFLVRYTSFPIPIYFGVMKILGWILVGTGVILIIWTIQTIGFKNFAGYRFFMDKQSTHLTRSGIFAYLKNPTYVGFVLLFIGIGLIVNSLEQFVLALLSFILLNCIEARVENTD